MSGYGFTASCEKVLGRNVLQCLPKGRATVMRHVLVTITLILAVMFLALAQTTAAPDFSGTWVLNAVKSTLPKDSTIKSQTIAIDNKRSAIVFHYKTDGKKLTESYTPDGKKRVSLNMSSGQLTSRASWHDSVLVIESTLDIMKALSPIRILHVPRRGSHLSAWPSDYSLLSASLTTFFILLFCRNQLLYASCRVVQPGARPWRTSTPLLPIIEFP